MSKYLTMSLGVLLMTGAVSAFAGSKDAELVSLCRADINAAYGEEVRTRLYRIRSTRTGKEVSLKAYPTDAEREVVSCVISREGEVQLFSSDGVAFNPTDMDTAEALTANQ